MEDINKIFKKTHTHSLSLSTSRENIITHNTYTVTIRILCWFSSLIQRVQNSSLALFMRNTFWKIEIFMNFKIVDIEIIPRLCMQRLRLFPVCVWVKIIQICSSISVVLHMCVLGKLYEPIVRIYKFQWLV